MNIVDDNLIYISKPFTVYSLILFVLPMVKYIGAAYEHFNTNGESHIDASMYNVVWLLNDIVLSNI